MRNTLLLFALLFAFTDLLFCQNDFFPLSPGSYFTYYYKYHSSSSYQGYPCTNETDSGTVKYKIINSTANDSIITWQVEESCNIKYKIINNLSNIDTTYIVNKNQIIPLIESKQLYHPIVFNSDFIIWISQINRNNTIYRYPADSDSMYYIHYEVNEGAVHSVDNIVFYKNQGLQHRGGSYSYTSMGSSYSTSDAVLLDSYVAGINEFNGNTINNYVLMQNYPNPFNPNTTISYQLPKSGQVTIKVYDVLGNEVKTLVNEYKPAGEYSVNFDAGKLSSGVYIYRITAGGYTSAKKMTLIK